MDMAGGGRTVVDVRLPYEVFVFVRREGEYHDDLEVGRWARWNVKGEPCEPAESSAPRV